MQNIRERVASLSNIRLVTQFIVLASTATMLPFFVHAQWLTGSLINAILILTLFMVGIRGAFFVCLIPSIMALSGGLLPAVLAPVVPFIMMSNVLYVLSIDWIFKVGKESEWGYWLGITIASAIKFLFLFLSVGLISDLLQKSELSTKIAQILTWPQLYTAFIGGMVAFVVLKVVKKSSKDKLL